MSTETWTTVTKKQVKPAQSAQLSTNTIKVTMKEPREDIVKKTTKALDSTKKNRILQLRSQFADKQQTLANKLFLNVADIRDAEQGKEISMKAYTAICKYIEKNMNV